MSEPRCIKCGKRRSDHNYFGGWGFLCHNGSATFLSEDDVTIRRKDARNDHR